jgi:hypothetical protein
MPKSAHKNCRKPYISNIPRMPRGPHGVFATNTHVYHPTKGWRKIGRDTRLGFAKINAFLARAFN